MNEIRLPKLGQAMEEGLVVEWLVEEGDAVSAGDSVVLIETDKMTSEVTADEAGELLSIEVPAGQTVSIGTVLGYVGSDPSELPVSGTDSVSEPGGSSGDQPTVRASPDAKRRAREAGVSVDSVGEALGVTQVRGEHVESFVTENNGSSNAEATSVILGSPYARRIAAEHDVSIQDVGVELETNRIRAADVEKYLGSVSPDPEEDEATSGERSVQQTIPIEGTRRVMFDRMSRVNDEYASTTTVARVDVTELLELRDRLSREWERTTAGAPSITAFVVRAVAETLPEYGVLNAEVEDDSSITVYDSINIGVAVSTDGELLVPTIRDADLLSVRELTTEINRLADRAKEDALSYDELQDGTFSVSNAGSLGAFLNTPQINPPQTGILGVCRVFDQPGIEDGELVERQLMHLTLTYDHRVIEGATAVGFLNDVQALLEHPYSLVS